MKSKYKIQIENSAPSQGKPAKSVLLSSAILKKLNVRSVVDLGCGRLRNFNVLRRYFPEITPVDTDLQCQRIRDLLQPHQRILLLSISEFEKNEKKYDAIFLISVLHVIDKPKQREKLLSIASSKLHNSGFLIVDVPTGERYYRQHCTNENKHGDGWVMGTGPVRTFYKNFYAEEFDDLIAACTEFRLYLKLSLDKHIIRIWRKGS